MRLPDAEPSLFNARPRTADRAASYRELGLRVVESEAVPPDTLVFVPPLEPRPGETQAQYRERVAAGSRMVRNVEVSDG